MFFYFNFFSPRAHTKNRMEIFVPLFDNIQNENLKLINSIPFLPLSNWFKFKMNLTFSVENNDDARTNTRLSLFWNLYFILTLFSLTACKSGLYSP